jgi:hypothetical protein
MSHNHHAAPVPFKVNFPHLYDVEVEYEDEEFWKKNPGLAEQVGEDLEVLPAERAIGKKIPEPLRRIVQATVLFDCYEVEAGPVKGWKAVKGDIDKEHGAKLKWIIAHKVVKGDHVAWYVNESDASNVGYVTPSFVAFDEASIKAIKKDFGGRIETDTVVNSSW